jgi:hypothetical protein
MIHVTHLHLSPVGHRNRNAIDIGISNVIFLIRVCDLILR